MKNPRAATQEIDALLSMIPGPAVAVDRAGVIQAANDPMGALAAHPRQHMIGMPLDDLLVGGAAVAGDALEADGSRAALQVLRCGDGSTQVVIEHRAEASSPGPVAAWAVVTLTDVTALTRSEEGSPEWCSHLGRLSDTVIDEALRLRRRLRALEEGGPEAELATCESHLDTIYTLAMASEARDEDTGAHLRRIAAYTQAAASALGLDPARAEAISTAAILHDVGKLHVPESLLQKTGRLTDPERETIQSHTTAGERILPDKPAFALARQIARHHHENWDGSGYPDGLAGESIPLAARIVHVVDVFDALVSKRPYKPPWPRPRAIAFLRQHAGAMFQPSIVDAVIHCIDSDDADRIAYACMLSSSRSAV